MSKVYITDTILRDAHQSLIATRLRTEDMLPVCPQLDRIGFWSLEVWGGATFDACLRFLKEDPWERLCRLREALPNTRLQMLLRGQNLLGYRHYPDDVVREFVRLAAREGIDVFRVFDALNDIRNLKMALTAVKEQGKHAQGTICYTISPVHTTALYVKLASEMVDMGADSIAIKDMAGLLTPHATSELVRHLREHVDVPLFLHSHATAGLAEMCQLKAIEAGCRHIDTALSAFAGGTSHPPTESMVAALRGTEHDTGLDLDALQEVSAYFAQVRRKYRQFESEFTGVDTRVQVNQVPGGMMSNLAKQLEEQGALNRIHEVFAEIPRVRRDLGYPPLVTPTSQIVGTQAVLNVITGERYKTITNEVKRYLQGGYGQPPAPVDAELKRKAIGHEAVIEARPADLLEPELDGLREEIGDLAGRDTDVMSFALFPEIARTFLEERREGRLNPEPLIPPSPIGTAPCGERFAPTEFKVSVHGETYDVHITGANIGDQRHRRFYITLDGVPQEIDLEVLSGYQREPQAGQRPVPSKPGDVVTTMPGNIVDILVKPGDQVQAGDGVLVTEAMKMETQIQAPIAGTVTRIHVSKGERVNPNEVLLEIEP
ncbi:MULTISPECIES: sodium-extruding oxaloacetate decarboxylase subunit alpha [Methylococcus]|uniref:Sodium-extruding oxaloacetate decarboxylase subunit alpha n=1 Tax=Methylococcus capsulatus TaxID=414 RepID=A0ABZ2F5S5_METCP|nr:MULTISPECIES: sodium-extruding oxaloacetate decarboxylase subunit alpha [Methylococcus]MDF9391111.1 oxaloacetate decarboxylase subunit alpha [Methylococcus capsulatus]